MSLVFLLFFFFNDTATTEIYTLSLHDALPISDIRYPFYDEITPKVKIMNDFYRYLREGLPGEKMRSEEHTSELQSH